MLSRKKNKTLVFCAVSSIFSLLFPICGIARTCDEIKAELSRLRATLAQEQQALQNCTNHLGTCSPGQTQSFQDAVNIAQQEISADEQELQTACAPPPPPPHRIEIAGVEVVQAVQDLNNSVDLIASKPTWVRVYLNKNSGSDAVTGTLQAQIVGTSTSTTIASLNPVTVDSADSLKTRRSTWTKSLNFQIPANFTADGTTQFTLVNLKDASPANHAINCVGCGAPTQAAFFAEPPLRVRVIGLSYQFTNPPGSATQTATPRAIDFALIQSWLTRAYPVAQVNFSQTTVPATNLAPPFDSGTVSCGKANTQIAAIRAQDMANNAFDARTHYLGLVSDQGDTMRGCAVSSPATADPTVVASGPSGAPTDSKVPVNSAGDTDASFADFYSGHELGHTFGRQHPGFCNNNSKDDPSFPYPNGQISDGTDESFAGLDVGDATNSIPLSVLWGVTSFDIMSYCQQPQWLSSYQYLPIRQRILDENPGFHPAPPPGPGAGTPGSFIHVVAILNLTKGTGHFEYVTPLANATQKPTPPGKASLRLFGEANRLIGEYPVEIKETTDTVPGEDKTATIDAAIPFSPRAVRLELLLDRNVLAVYRTSLRRPATVQHLRREPSPPGATRQTGITVRWNAVHVSGSTVTYLVSGSRDMQTWETIAVGLEKTSIAIPDSQPPFKAVRVSATNGFRQSVPATLTLP